MTAPSSTPPLFQVEAISKRYGDRQVLDDLSFDVQRGETLVILGRSGSGKSVTLRQLNGLEKPDEGQIRFDGEEITTLEEHELYPLRRRIAMLFQSGALFDSMTVGENVAFPLREHSLLGEEEIAATVRQKLELVELAGIEEKMPADLSGGMRKRAALARSLALDPEVILFDEPTTGLDPMTSATIAHLIRGSTLERDKTAVVVTHDLPLTAIVASRIAFLDEGRFRFVGTWEQAQTAADPVLHRFLAGEREEGA